MFQAGDYIVYGNTGVCQICELVVGDRKLRWLEKGKRYYRLQPLYQTGCIYAPIEDAKVPMRPVSTADEVNRLIDQSPDLQAESFHSKNLHELKARYQEATKGTDCAGLIELLLSIYVKKQEYQSRHKRLGQMDERFMHQAEDLLHGEFSVALGIPKEEIAAYITTRIKGRMHNVE